MFVNLSGLQLNTIHANDFQFYEELNAVVQHEPVDWVDPDMAGLFAGIGIKKGALFAPDARMKAILVDAVAVGNAAARAILFAPRDQRTKSLSGPAVVHLVLQPAATNSRIAASACWMREPCSTTTPRVSRPRWPGKPGTGSAYAIAARDSQGRYFDGSKTYKVTLPAPMPAGQFWSFTVYDNQTRSMLETDQKLLASTARFPH